MNSAPVQLLPIDTGSGYKQKTPDAESAVERNGRFEDVFNRTAAQNGSPPEKKPVEDGKEGLSTKKKTESSETKSESGKKKDEADVVVREDAAAGKSADEAEKLKSGLSKKKDDAGLKLSEKTGADGGKTVKEFPGAGGKDAKSDRLKKIAHEIGKLSSEGGLKTASEGGSAGILNGIRSDKKTAGTDGNGSGDKNNRLLEKLKSAAESAGKPGTAGEGKAEIRLVAVVPQDVKHPAAPDSKDAAQKKKADGKVSGQDSGLRKNKFRIVDHRKHHEPVSSSPDKAAKHSVSESAAKNDTQGSFKDALGGVHHENAKPDSAMPQARQLQSSVLSQLKDSVNSQIVKQAGIVVKGNGTGEIKLVMKPESLGNVRIHLSLNDNHIAGRIIVENNIVREIFESNLENLYKAFGSEGFENGGLEVSVEGQGGNTENGGRRNGRSIGARAARALEAAVPELEENEWRNNAVNMVV